MTSYWHTITLNDGERSALVHAAKHMIEYHRAQIESGGGVPHHAYLNRLEQLLLKIEDAEMSMRSWTEIKVHLKK